MTVFFCFEVVIKVIADGLLLNGEGSYLNVSWNRVDFLVVIISVFDHIESGTNTYTSFKVIRIARLIRPMRLLSKNEGLKVAI